MKKANELIESFYNKLNINDNKNYTGFFSAWEVIVGSNLAEHCVSSDIKKGALLVVIDHPGWFQQFKLSEKQILHKIKTKFPDLGIVRIVYKIEQKPLDNSSGLLRKVPKVAANNEIVDKPESEINTQDRHRAENLPDDLQKTLANLQNLIQEREKE